MRKIPLSQEEYSPSLSVYLHFSTLGFPCSTQKPDINLKVHLLESMLSIVCIFEWYLSWLQKFRALTPANLSNNIWKRWQEPLLAFCFPSGVPYRDKQWRTTTPGSFKKCSPGHLSPWDINRRCMYSFSVMSSVGQLEAERRKTCHALPFLLVCRSSELSWLYNAWGMVAQKAGGTLVI